MPTYPLSLPDTKFKTFAWMNPSAVAAVQSPWTYQMQVQAHEGMSWAAEISLPPKEPTYAEPWRAFFAQLNGMFGTFLMGDPMRAAPRGTAAGTPLCEGGGQTGQILNIDGWTPSQTLCLAAGDLIQIGSRLYMNMTNKASDINGRTQCEIWPSLRESPADNAPVITTSPKGTFRLSSSIVRLGDANEELLHFISFAAIEAL